MTIFESISRNNLLIVLFIGVIIYAIVDCLREIYKSRQSNKIFDKQNEQLYAITVQIHDIRKRMLDSYSTGSSGLYVVRNTDLELRELEQKILSDMEAKNE